MRAFAMTGIVTAAMMPSIISGAPMRATPPSRRMSAGTRSSAMTASAPASSAILACSASTTSMITPPRSISARPRFTGTVPWSWAGTDDEGWLMRPVYERGRRGERASSTRSGPDRAVQPAMPCGPPRWASSELAQQRDALLGRRAQPEPLVDLREAPLLGGLRRRLLDPEVGGGVAHRVHDRRRLAQALQAGDEPRRVAGDGHARDVGPRLALRVDHAAHDGGDRRRQPEQRRADGREEGQRAGFAALAPVEGLVGGAAHAPPAPA